MNSEHHYIQFSKRIALQCQIQWVAVVVIVIVAGVFGDLSGDKIDILTSIITWSATLAGIGITGYMGNSSIEKYAAKKFSLIKTVEETEIEGGSNG